MDDRTVVYSMSGKGRVNTIWSSKGDLVRLVT